MLRWISLSLAIVSTLGCVASAPTQPASEPVVCSDAWYRSVEQQLGTGDGQGHGPDIGSAEWKSVVEFKLGIRGDTGIPDSATAQWCDHIEQRLQSRPSVASGPAFNCDGDALSAAEKRVCSDVELASLDRQLSQVYQQALEATDRHDRPTLKAEQRGWIKGRDECWKSRDSAQCVDSAYRLRIAALQAQYRLVAYSEAVRFVCNDNPADEFVVTFFQTEPETAILERGDRVSLMYRQPAASGARYQGRNESFWEHQGEARIRWGYQADELRCVPVRQP